MTDEKRIGVLSSARNATWLEEALSGRLTATPLDGGTLEETLSHYQAINVRTVVVDDDLLYGRPEAEEALARWAKSHGHPRVRIVLYMDSGRPIDDPYLFRLVSDAEVRDILVAAENGEAAARLLHLIDEPMAPIEYERWRTNDPGVWQHRKPGLFEGLFGTSKKKEKMKKAKKGKSAAKRKRPKGGLEPEPGAEAPVEAAEGPRPEAGQASEERPSGQEPAARKEEEASGPGQTTARTSQEAVTGAELGDVASVYGIDLGDAGERDGERTRDGEDMERNKANADERKRPAIDLGGDDATRKKPRAEAPEARSGKPASARGSRYDEKPGGRMSEKEEEKAEGEGSVPARNQAGKTEGDGAGQVHEGSSRRPETRQEASGERAAALSREVVGAVAEDVRAQAIASPAPGTVTLTFPGSSLGSILESFVRPGADRRQGVSFPTARNVVAVSALRPGMGCSHVSVALGVALASEHVSVSVALRTRFNVSRMLDGLSDSYETNGVGVSWRGCDFYYWDDQRRFSSEYDVVVADCGVLDTSDNSRNSPTNLFVNHARVGLVLTGGSPWDLPLLDNVLSRFDARTTREWRFGCCRTTADMLESLEETFAGIYHDGRKRMWPVPYSPSLFDGSTPRLAAYREVLDPVLPKSLRYPKAQAKAQEDAPAEEPVETDSGRGRPTERKEEAAKTKDAPKPGPGAKEEHGPSDVEAGNPGPGVNPEGTLDSAPEDQRAAPKKGKPTRKRSHGERAASKARPAEE